MSELLSDIGCAILLALLVALLGPRLLPRLKHVHWAVLFVPVLIVTGLVGVFATPLGTPVYDAITLIAATLLTVGVILPLASQRGAVPPVTRPDEHPPAAQERRTAAVGVAFSYLWFAVLLLMLVGMRWAVY